MSRWHGSEYYKCLLFLRTLERIARDEIVGRWARSVHTGVGISVVSFMGEVSRVFKERQDLNTFQDQEK